MKPEPPMNIKHGIIAFTVTGEEDSPTISVLHFCGYEEPPTEHDWKNLEDELNTDEDFGLVGRINKDVFLMVADEKMVVKMKLAVNSSNES